MLGECYLARGVIAARLKPQNRHSCAKSAQEWSPRSYSEVK